MTTDMLDWWTIPGRTWGVKNLDFKVELIPDDGARLEDSDGYSERDEELHDQGEWQFAIVRVIPVGEDLTDHVGAAETLGNVAWGQLSEVHIERRDLTDYPLRDMAEEAARRLTGLGLAVEVEPGSDFKLTAPF